MSAKCPECATSESAPAGTTSQNSAEMSPPVMAANAGVEPPRIKPPDELFAFEVLDRVKKVSGDYQHYGNVIARGWNSRGKARYLVEIEEGGTDTEFGKLTGMLHVYSAAQLWIANILADDGVSLR